MPLLQRFVQVRDDASSAFFVLGVCLELENVDAALMQMDKIRERREAAEAGSSPKAVERQADWTMRTTIFDYALDLCVRKRQWTALVRMWDMRQALRVQPNIFSLYLVAHALRPQSASWSAARRRSTCSRRPACCRSTCARRSPTW